MWKEYEQYRQEILAKSDGKNIHLIHGWLLSIKDWMREKEGYLKGLFEEEDDYDRYCDKQILMDKSEINKLLRK